MDDGWVEGGAPKVFKSLLTSHVTIWIHRVFSCITQKLCAIAVTDRLQHSHRHALLPKDRLVADHAFNPEHNMMQTVYRLGALCLPEDSQQCC